MVRFISILKLTSTHKPTKHSNATHRCEKNHEKCSLETKILTFLSHFMFRGQVEEKTWHVIRTEIPEHIPNKQRLHRPRGHTIVGIEV